MNEDYVPLDTICDDLFNLTPRIARRKAANNMLPVPAFRLTNTQRGPFYVLKSDVDKWVSNRIEKAKQSHRTMRLAV